MEVITLRTVKDWLDGKREVVGTIPGHRRELYVVDEPGTKPVTKIYARDTGCVVGSGSTLRQAASEVAEIYKMQVRVLRTDGTERYTVEPRPASELSA